MNYRGEEDLLTIIRLLLKKGSKLDSGNNFGISPRDLILERHVAVSKGGAMEKHPTAKDWDLIDLIK